MQQERKPYTSPLVRIIHVETTPMMTGSKYINTANQEYDGRTVLARECRSYLWFDEEED
ncbi:MAG: hypothetical protein IJ914_08110 [Prevotella sp.]|nr:hypothetical protein [Prevotella sp.]